MLDVFLHLSSNRISYYETAGRIIAFDPFSSPALSTRSISARISLRFSRSDFASSYLRCALASCTKLSRRASCSNNGWSICARAASRSATLASGVEVPLLDGDAVAEGLGRDCDSNVHFVRRYVRSVCDIYRSGFQFDIPMCDFASVVRVPGLECMYHSSLERDNEGCRLEWQKSVIMVRVLGRVVLPHLLRFKGRTWSGNMLRWRNRFARLSIAV